MKLAGVIAAMLAVAAVAAGGWFGRAVPIAEQWPMFEALRTTAAIIFGVIGAWMAIIYPERLKLSFSSQSSTETRKAVEAAASGGGWGQLFSPVVHSTLILSVVLILGVLYPILRTAKIDVPLEVLRGCSYGLLTALTLWQLWTVVLTLVPADRVKSSLDASEADTASKAALTQLGSKRSRAPAAPTGD